MKKLFLIVFTVFLTTTSFSQGIDFGIKVGANFTNLTNVEDATLKKGFVFGGFVTLKFSDKFSAQGDLLYSQQGAIVDIGYTDDIHLDYINFPIVIKYYIFERLNIQAGPQFGLVVDVNIDNSDYETFDVTGVLGIGFDLPLNLRVTGRYNIGVTDIGVIEFHDSTITTKSVKNNVFSLSIGFSFI
jgi:hypothetical protein